MSAKKVVKKTIVNSMMEGFDFRNPSWSWYEHLYMRVKWKWDRVSYWWTRKREKWQLGFPREESWQFNHYHSKYVAKRLRHFRDNLTGIPSEMFPDNYDHSGEYKMDEDERKRAHDKARRKWYDTLTKIIWTFEHWDDIKDPVYPDDYDSRYEMEEYECGGLGFKSLDDRSPDYTLQKEHDKKIDEGLQLFVKYYRNLWD